LLSVPFFGDRARLELHERRWARERALVYTRQDSVAGL
jgi:hypothetical protein